MNTDLFAVVIKKRHKNIMNRHMEYMEYNDYPVAFQSGSRHMSKKNFYKVDKDLNLKKAEAHQTLKSKENITDNNFLLAKSLNIGYYLITPLLIGVFFGYWLDKFFKTRPFFLLLLFSVGIIASFYNLWKIVQESK